ncbi:hypothetical protein VaNZ11_012897 [Volvox africanus]|uniref:F-box domain-containing protein n=1 Tax=Volvox africanus TaxID=51714 RepID=A0ABQ5SFT2_9CHLO|nr:hypothetical protein VaNZ11_012897 [Volvox africanus]
MNALSDPASMTDNIGHGERAPLSSTEKVFHDPNLLHYIAIYLKPRGRLAFSTLSRACTASVMVPDFWDSISGSIIERNGAVKKASWSYSEAAQYGNRLGCVLRQYGRFCTRLHLADCAWLQVTGLEDLARCSNLVHLDMSGCRYEVCCVLWGERRGVEKLFCFIIFAQTFEELYICTHGVCRPWQVVPPRVCESQALCKAARFAAE